VSSLAARHLVPPLSQAAGNASWSHAAVVLGKSWGALIPYLVMGAFVTILTRSSAAGMALAIGYYLGEHVVMAVLGGFSSRSEIVARYLLGQNIDAWAGISFLGLGHTKIGVTHAVLVLAAYTLALAAAAFYLFERSDVTGPSAG
jgi:ABC-type transport system involved in multi-copper enzyme maturation permease subunit